MKSIVTGLATLVAVTMGLKAGLRLDNPTSAAMLYLLVVLLAATISTLRAAIALSVLAVAFLNFYFMPPVGTFSIADPQNWIALFAFLVVSVVASELSSTARARAREATARRDELARLFDLSRDVLLTTNSADDCGGPGAARAMRWVWVTGGLDPRSEGPG